MGTLAFIVIDINPILAQIGPVALRWYGLMYVVGIAVGLRIAYPYALKRGITDDDFWAIVWPAVFAGLVGARLYYVLQQPLGPFLAEPWRILATWEGGMAFYGAIFGVAVTLVVVARQRGFDLWAMLDAAALFGVIGQAFGRVGNIINGDIVGAPTTLPWGFVYIHPNSFVPDHTIAYQPAAVYELLFNLAFFAVLYRLRFRMPRSGLLFAVYLIGYSLGQFGIFFLRTEPLVAFGLKQAQVTALVVLVAALALTAWLASRRGQATTAA
ncbi:MAG: prolipoprotein diacylglyceryl transferase [Chloroflexi bacterium]|nr:prolipoprotein diacylglyceryl transferase [Bacteroidota bacterium]MCL5109876.1 prolipoprotein diacylglyceryl transferase [Chloroflexota bacterium]